MKKLILLPLLFAATMIFADDVSLSENFSGIRAEIGADINTNNTASGLAVTGDVCKWNLTFVRWNGSNDKITVGETKIPCMWLSKDATNTGKIETTNLEGGIKAVSFRWAQFGAEASNTLQLQAAAGTITDDLPTRDGADGANNTTGGEEYSHTFACKSNAQLAITNISTKGGKNNCRILVGSLVITPYLLYTTKAHTLDMLNDGNTYINNDLVNNTDGDPVVYSISENTIGATIDAATGEVTATNGGEVTVTASWEGVSTSYTLTILSKTVATAAFDNDVVYANIEIAAPVNNFTTNSSAVVEYSSSDESVATVDATTGVLNLVGLGTTTITANVPENAEYFAASASYTLRVVLPNFNIETFDGAENVDLSTGNTYLTTATESFNPSIVTGLKWTTLLGSVRNSLGGSPATNLAAAVRAKKNAETAQGYLLSSTISGGIDSIAFDWNANGSEASRQHPWDIKIYINDELIGSITDNGAAIQPMGSWFRFTKGGLKIDGDFTIKIVNDNVPDDGSGNQYRFVIDNIEWYSYVAPTYAVTYDAMPEHGLLSVFAGSTPLASGDEVKEGTVLTIVPAPGDDYEIDAVTANGVNVEAVESVYSIIMGAEPVVIAATFKEKGGGTDLEELKNQKSQINNDKVLQDGVIYILRNGVIYELNGRAL